MSALLEVDELNLWIKQGDGSELHIVRDVSFAVAAGERLGLVGESGCGKTSAMLSLMGLLPPNAIVSGEVRLDGVDVLRQGERSARHHRWSDIAMVFQGAMNAFSPVRTVGHQIAEPLRSRGTGRSAAGARVRELLELVGIHPDAADRYPHEFSGGMRQRAALAMALVLEPRVLLADEPTTALDVLVQAQVLRLLERLSDELDLAVVFVTHDLPVVSQICHRAAVMYAGRIVEDAPVGELRGASRHPYTELLFAATPELTGSRRKLQSIPGAPPRLDAELEGCPFHPRCPQRHDACLGERPRLEELTARHAAACHLNHTAVS